MRRAGPAQFAFAFIAVSAGLCAGAEKQTFFLRPNGAIPFLEVVGPGDDAPEGFLVGKGRGRPEFFRPPSALSVSWVRETSGCFNLAGHFLPVSGVLSARARMLPASAGGRTLLVYSYNHSTAISVFSGGRALFEGEAGKDVPTRVPLELADTSEVVIGVEVSPRYKYSLLALLWQGGGKDEVLASSGMDIDEEVLKALSPRLSPAAPRPGEEAVLNFADSAVPAGASAEALGVRLPGGEAKRVKQGEVSFLLPEPATSPCWRFALGYTWNGGEVSREVRFPNPSGIEAAFKVLKTKAGEIPLAERRKYPLFLLRVEQLEEVLGPEAFGRDWEKALKWVEEAEKAYEIEKKGGGSYGKTPGFREDAYVSDVDLSPQPYLLYVPSGAEPPWPLVVYLHGYVPSYVRSDWIGPNPQELALYERFGAAWVCPFGRSNTDFLTVGERDVLDVVEEVKRRFEIDEDRIHLLGYSMGGSGAWTLLCHYPDVWASALILAGRTDFYLWHDLDPATLSPWLNYMIRMDNPIDLACNAARVPVTVLHGDVDWVVKKGHSTRMVQRLRELGGRAELFWLTGCDHWRALLALQEEDIVARLFKHRRSREKQASGRYVVYTPKYGQVGGLSVEALGRWMEPGEVSFTKEAEQLRLSCNGVAALRLPETSAAPVPDGFQNEGGICCPVIPELREGGCTPFPAKGPGLSGCFKDVTCGPFAIVYGTDGPRTTALRAAADDWADVWYRFARGKALVFADRDLPGEVFRGRNLILIGEAEENSVVRRISGRLPFRINDGRVTLLKPGGGALDLGGGGADEGYIITYPNRLTGRYAAFTGTVMWGERLSINHKWDFVPDVAVFRRAGEGFMDSDEYLWAGFFDAFWRVDEGLLFQGHQAAERAARPSPQ